MNKLLTSVIISVILAGCGGGGSDSSTPVTTPSQPTSPTTPTTPTTPPAPPVLTNTISLKVDGGVNGNYFNGLFGSVTVCKPNTANNNAPGNCTTIDHVLFDTGSVGLRLFSQSLPSGFNLPNSVDSQNNNYAQCMQFASGVTWGTINNADIKMNGEIATNIPVQIIGDSQSTIPQSCASIGKSFQVASDLGANGIIGIGLFKQDCGKACETVVNNTLYYKCTPTGCTNTTIPISQQVQNPIAKFPQDNNGTIIVLNDVPDNGAVSTSGTLYFGIGTQTNNTKNLSTIKTNSRGLINITYNGKVFNESFIDSGSSITSFTDPNLKACTKLTDYFCPDTPTNLPILISSFDNSNSLNSSVRINNAETLLSRTNNVVFNNVVGNSDVFSNTTIDLGLSYFMGKTVATGLEGTNSNLGTGTYFAF